MTYCCALQQICIKFTSKSSKYISTALARRGCFPRLRARCGDVEEKFNVKSKRHRFFQAVAFVRVKTKASNTRCRLQIEFPTLHDIDWRCTNMFS